MANYAVINGNQVTNVIVAETKEIAEEVTNLTCVEYTQDNPAAIGWAYDGEKFTAPVVEAIDPETPTE